MITNERISSYIHSLDKELPENLRRIEKEALKDNVPIIKKPTITLLRFLINSRKPIKVLEVGTAVGFSSLLMREYMPEEGRITTIEKVPQRIKKAKENILSLNKENGITLLEGDAKEVLKDLVKKKEKFDFIFMDAAKGQYIHFLEDIMKLLEINGLLVSDNVLQDGDLIESRYSITRRDRTIHSRMREYLYNLTHIEELDTVILQLGDGVTLSTRIK